MASGFYPRDARLGQYLKINHNLSYLTDLRRKIMIISIDP